MPALSTRRRWGVQRARAWEEGQPWRVGVNLLPSSAVNSTEMWQEETFDPDTLERELGWARGLGLSAVRVFLQFLVHARDPAGHLARLETFLALAERHEMVVLPVLLDDCAFSGREPYLGPQDEPAPGVHNGGWTPSPGPRVVRDPSAWPAVRRYVQDVVDAFRADERILGWDLYNEPGNAGMGEDSLPLLRAVFGWARDAQPAQPLTAAPWDPRLARLNAMALGESDVLSTHSYRSLALLREEVEHLAAHGRPVWVTEWMMRPQFAPRPGTGGSRLETHLPYLRERGITGFVWGLVNGRTQTHFPWSSTRGAAEPDLWFHDLLDREGRPHRASETELLRALTQMEAIDPTVHGPAGRDVYAG